MATRIGRNSTGEVTIAAVAYALQFQAFSVRCVVPQIDITTFADEPDGASEAGPTTFIASLNGLLMKGAGAWTSFMPAPQGVAMTLQYDVSCTIAGNWNFEDTLAVRPAGANASLAAVARSTGPVVVSWVTA